ncbi:hypothetical protein ACFQW6_10190 [Nocardioides sp. GCM10028917]|uniref:hypothetical protein n=1 Tax=Nocardioides sp. GCM10028917 TaxID=3273408 RepID=UPI00361AA7D2
MTRETFARSGPSGTRTSLVFFATAVLLLLLAGCGGGDADVTDSDSSDASETPAETSEEAKVDDGTIVESGFGQQGQYAWVTALVRNDSDHGGQTVTVNFNVLDEAGELVASGSQVSSFSWADQEVPVATQVDLGKRVKAAKIEAAVLVEDEGTFEEYDPEGWQTEIPGKVYQPEYSNTWGAKFTVANPSAEPLDGSALQVVCHDAAGNIIGGSSAYPELIPPSGKILVDVSSVYATQKPADCLGYHTPWM